MSVDSLTWSRVELGRGGPSLAITAGGPGLVGVGVYHEPDPEDLADGGGGPGWVQGYRDIPTVWTSPDGYEWSRVSEDDVFDLDVEIADIAAGDAGVVAVAEHHVWTSPDGIVWSRLPEGTFTENADRLSGVIAGGPGFVAFGEDEMTSQAAVWTSPDGLAWTRVPDDPAVFDASIHAMTVGGPGLVAVGSDEDKGNPVIWTSSDGSTWTRLPHDPAVFGEANPEVMFSEMRINDVAAGGPGLVAVGSGMPDMSRDEPRLVAAVWTSPDGVPWTRVPHDPALFEGPLDAPWAMIQGVAAVGDGFVAIGSTGESPEVWTSRDGTVWTRITEEFDITDATTMEQVTAGGPGAVIISHQLIEDYGASNQPPWSETTIWVGSQTGPTE